MIIGVQHSMLRDQYQWWDETTIIRSLVIKNCKKKLHWKLNEVKAESVEGHAALSRNSVLISYFTVKVVIYTDGSVCVFYGQTIRVGIKYTFALFSTKRLDYLSLKRGGIFWGFKLIA